MKKRTSLLLSVTLVTCMVGGVITPAVAQSSASGASVSGTLSQSGPTRPAAQIMNWQGNSFVIIREVEP